MQRSGYICIPLRRQSGEIAAYALIDHEDAEQATHRWHLSANMTHTNEARNALV
jgi:hypothetical protein